MISAIATCDSSPSMASKADDDHEEAQDACIGGEWRLNEVTRKHREIQSKLGLPLL